MNPLEREYTEHHARSGRLRFTFGGAERAGQLRAWIGVGRRVLDLGCRDGALTAQYQPGNSVVGLDIDRRALIEGRAAARLKNIAQADLTRPLPFASGWFDVVVCGEILEHLPFPAWLVREAARVLAPGGAFIGSVPNAYRLKNRLRFLLGAVPDPDPTHLRFFSRALLRAMLDPHFANVEIRPMIGRFVFLGPGLFSNDLLWFGRKAG